MPRRKIIASTKPPVARTDAVHDTYFGETVDDPYRWMENDKDPGWSPFLKAQNDYTRAVLDKSPGRDALLKRIQQLSGDTVQTQRLQRAGGKLFFQQRPLGADNFKLFVARAGHDRVLVDPTKLSSSPKVFASKAAPAISRSIGGERRPTARMSCMDCRRMAVRIHYWTCPCTVSDGKDLPEHIENTQTANPQWLDDGSGLFLQPINQQGRHP